MFLILFACVCVVFVCLTVHPPAANPTFCGVRGRMLLAVILQLGACILAGLAFSVFEGVDAIYFAIVTICTSACYCNAVTFSLSSVFLLLTLLTRGFFSCACYETHLFSVLQNSSALCSVTFVLKVCLAVGFGDFTPETFNGRLFFILYALLSSLFFVLGFLFFVVHAFRVCCACCCFLPALSTTILRSHMFGS